MTDERDVRVEFKLRNNLILTMMERQGIPTVMELCRQMGSVASQERVGKLVNMRERARTKSGAWRKLALDLANFFGCEPEDLFSDAQQWNVLVKERVHVAIASHEIERLSMTQQALMPDDALAQKQLTKVMNEALHSLTPREERVLRLRFYEDLSLEEIGVMFGVYRERVRQVEAKALRKLKHPSRARKFRDYLEVLT